MVLEQPHLSLHLLIGERHAGERSPPRVLYIEGYKDPACSLAALYNGVILYSVSLTAMSYSDLSFDDDEDGYHLDDASSTTSLNSEDVYEMQRIANVRESYYARGDLTN